MFDRFTDRARKVMALARKEADRFDHDSIGTEHILAGLIGERSGVAGNVLTNLGVTIGMVRREIDKHVRPRSSTVTIGQLPFAAEARKVLERTMEESIKLGHRHIGTEHLLLGLLRECECVATQVLRDLEVPLDDARKQVHELLGLAGVKSVHTCEACGEEKRGNFEYLPRSRDRSMLVCETCAEGILAAWEQFLKDHFGIE